MTDQTHEEAVAWLTAAPRDELRVVLAPDDVTARRVRAAVPDGTFSWQVIAPWQVPQLRHRRPPAGRTFRYAVLDDPAVFLAGVVGGPLEHLPGGPPP